MTKATLMLVAVLLMSSTAKSQIEMATEKQLASQTIQLYFDGWATGDSTKVGKAMHSTCHLKFFRDGKFSDIDRNSYLSGFKIRERDKDLITRMVLLDITENIASAKTEIVTAKYIFTDYFNLIKTDESWFIVDKVSVRKAK